MLGACKKTVHLTVSVNIEAAMACMHAWVHPRSSSTICAAGSCGQNNTCGGGAFPQLQGFQCKGFNPEGADLGTAGRCAANAYDNMGYLTLDFTCSTTVCKADGDCQLVRQPLGCMVELNEVHSNCASRPTAMLCAQRAARRYSTAKAKCPCDSRQSVMQYHHGMAGKLTEQPCAGLHVCVQHGMSGRQRAVHEQMHPSGSLLVPRHVC